MPQTLVFIFALVLFLLTFASRLQKISRSAQVSNELLGAFDMGAFGCSWVLLGKQSKSTNSTKQQKKKNGSIKNETTVSPAATRLNLRLYIIIIITGRERERERESYYI